MQERKRLSLPERNGFIKSLTASGYSSEIVELVKDDLEFGLTKPEIDRYLDKKWDIRQKRVYSQCFREEYGDEVISVIMREGLDGYQMQVALEFYQKGIPLDAISRVMEEGGTAKEMKKAYDNILKELEQLKLEEGSEKFEKGYVEKLVEQIAEVVEKIHYQERRYDELNKKLTIFESTKEDEAIRENLIRQLADTEADLSSRQDQLNLANATIARLREQAEEKEKERKRMQTRIDTLEDKLLERASEKTNEKKEPSSDSTVKNTETVFAGSEQKAEKTRTYASAEVFGTKPFPIPVYYQVPVVDGQGRVLQHVPVERIVRKSNTGGVTGIMARLGLKKKTRQDIVKLVSAGDLVPAQLVQIKNAMERGLTEGQLVELINNNVSAEKMKEIIEIAVLENSME